MLKNYPASKYHPFDVILVKDFSQDEMIGLENDYHIEPQLLEYVNDKKGPARIDDDTDDENVIMVFWVPVNEKSHSEPVSVIFQGQNMFVFSNSKMSFFNQSIEQLLVKQHDTRTAFLFDLILLTMDRYIDIISRLSERAEHIQAHLSSHRNNKNFEDLTRVNQDIVFLRPSIQENSDCFAEIKSFYKDARAQPDKSDIRQIHKINIAVKQTTRMIDLISENIQQLSDAYDRLINNDLNSIMRFLTVWSLLLAIPPIVSGFYGMNMHLPLAQNNLSWLFSLVVTAVLMLILVIYLRQHHSL
ncbi:magnesium transporter CorA family protein [Oenococcus sicerae]|uniref:Magnesium transporter CorA family protein n=2 Tax=Oenococcus sicerae TaxID=2203724 RepID=A0AAJ1R964_9LACO|nr:magnesium transporter CorA family protein [Oenococcus sicerae]MDN6900378.1 magnesium transporter CorA family protein [Oenococcus sicerae]